MTETRFHPVMDRVVRGLCSIARRYRSASGLSGHTRLRPLRCRRIRRAAAERDRIDGADHPPLNDLVLVDGDVPDARDVLHIDILQRAPQLPCSRNGLAVAVTDVEIDVTPDAAGQTGAKHRIQAYRELDGSTKLVEARHHIGQ